MSVGIVIPVWNLWEKMTLPCLMSLVKYTNLSDIHVYLVDNASTDKTATHAESMGQNLFGKDHFTYIKNSENMGFAIACNQGAKEAQKDGHEFILFLNNDTIVTENWLPPLVKALDNPRVGMAGPLLLYPDTTVQHCGVVITPFNEPKHIYAHFPYNHFAIKTRKYKIITGAAFLCRTNEFMQYGGFFEEYKNGFEDIDLSYTFFENGQTGIVVTESIVYHLESQTPGRKKIEAAQHNGTLLLKRKKNIIVDAHLYFARDGYLPAITKDYTFYVRLNEEKQKELDSYIYSEKKCLSMIQQEPFWYNGYYVLIAHYQKQGKILEAIAICEKLLSFYLSSTNLNLLENLLEDLHLAELNEKMSENVKIYKEAIKEKYIKHKIIFQKKLWGTDWYDKLIETQSLDEVNSSFIQ